MEKSGRRTENNPFPINHSILLPLFGRRLTFVPLQSLPIAHLHWMLRSQRSRHGSELDPFSNSFQALFCIWSRKMGDFNFFLLNGIVHLFLRNGILQMCPSRGLLHSNHANPSELSKNKASPRDHYDHNLPWSEQSELNVKIFSVSVSKESFSTENIWLT